MIIKKREVEPRSFGTHDGTFHADEVTACALLLLFDLIDSDQIVRTRDEERLARCAYVCDVGGVYDPAHRLFDHHQAEYKGGMSSAGMILLYLKEEEIITPHAYDMFNNVLIRGVDDHDNGRDLQMPGVCTYSHILANFVPLHQGVSASEFDEAFFEGLAFAKGHLERMWHRYQYICSCREEVEQAMKGAREYLLFSRTLPWLESFFELGGDRHPARFVIMPTGTHWKLRGIPPSMKNKMDVRCPLPEEWAGLLDKELKEVSGIPGAIFCHKGRFISVWETQEDALKALDYVLKKERR